MKSPTDSLLKLLCRPLQSITDFNGNIITFTLVESRDGYFLVRKRQLSSGIPLFILITASVMEEVLSRLTAISIITQMISRSIGSIPHWVLIRYLVEHFPSISPWKIILSKMKIFRWPILRWSLPLCHHRSLALQHWIEYRSTYSYDGFKDCWKHQNGSGRIESQKGYFDSLWWSHLHLWNDL